MEETFEVEDYVTVEIPNVKKIIDVSRGSSKKFVGKDNSEPINSVCNYLSNLMNTSAINGKLFTLPGKDAIEKMLSDDGTVVIGNNLLAYIYPGLILLPIKREGTETYELNEFISHTCADNYYER